MDIKVGDIIGGIYKKTNSESKDIWELYEDKITKIVSNTKGTKVYSKRFHPLDIDEIIENTHQMEEAKGYIITNEVFRLNKTTRPKCERWVEWANANPDKLSVW